MYCRLKFLSARQFLLREIFIALTRLGDIKKNTAVGGCLADRPSAFRTTGNFSFICVSEKCVEKSQITLIRVVDPKATPRDEQFMQYVFKDIANMKLKQYQNIDKKEQSKEIK